MENLISYNKINNSFFFCHISRAQMPTKSSYKLSGPNKSYRIIFYSVLFYFIGFFKDSDFKHNNFALQRVSNMQLGEESTN
uniref:Uncharacterized protein n=1 Tax=Rhizophora mucronata TaxID=61149 RepID=A0A2P2QYF8_RHIMU